MCVALLVLKGGNDTGDGGPVPVAERGKAGDGCIPSLPLPVGCTAAAAQGFLVNMAAEQGEASGEQGPELRAFDPPLSPRPPLPSFFYDQHGSAPASPSRSLTRTARVDPMLPPLPGELPGASVGEESSREYRPAHRNAVTPTHWRPR